MTDRPSFEETFMRMAEVLSLRSSCSRLKVGCIITTNDHSRVLSVGYNGNAPGLLNDACKSNEPGKCCDPLHAEENAIIACTATPDVPKHVFCTHLPCLMCSKRLLRLGGVRYVFYRNTYRNTEGLELLRSPPHSIAMIHLTGE